MENVDAGGRRVAETFLQPWRALEAQAIEFAKAGVLR